MQSVMDSHHERMSVVWVDLLEQSQAPLVVYTCCKPSFFLWEAIQIEYYLHPTRSQLLVIQMYLFSFIFSYLQCISWIPSCSTSFRVSSRRLPSWLSWLPVHFATHHRSCTAGKAIFVFHFRIVSNVQHSLKNLLCAELSSRSLSHWSTCCQIF